ncbi:MAG TPA: YceI family protein [Anditalea sp.]|nr:YceI family protein [Anditalea sp.]
MTTLFIIWSILFIDPTNSVERVRWIVSEDSRLEIEGATNINKYNCSLVDYSGADVLIQDDEAGVGNMSWAGDIVMKANNFDCFNPMMTKDFLKTVQADEYPEIKIRFLELTGSRDPLQKEAFYGKVDITIAGVTKRFPVSCQLVSLKENYKKLVGSQSFTFTDFGIDPPVKFLGTVKVKDEIKVNFELFLVGNK